MSIFGRLSKSNFHILFINLLIIFIAYNFMMDYLKNAPITHQEINGLKFTLIGGFKKKEEKFYFKLTIVNNTNSDTTIVLEKPMLKFIIEQTEKILYETDFSQDYNNADTAVLQLKKKEKIEFLKNVNLQNLKLTNGSYKLIALLYNPQRYQIISYFKIGKQNYL